FDILPPPLAVDDLLKSGRVNMRPNCTSTISLMCSLEHPIDLEVWMNDRTFRGAGQEVRIEAVPGDLQETRASSLMFGIGVNSDAGLTGCIVLNERNFDIKRPPTAVKDLLEGGRTYMNRCGPICWDGAEPLIYFEEWMNNRT